MWITNILSSAENGNITPHRSAGTYLLSYRPSLLSRNQCHYFPLGEIHISNSIYIFFSDPSTFPRATYIVPKANLPFINFDVLLTVHLSTFISLINPLTPNDHHSCRTAPLTSKRCILCIYSTNICIAYFKHGIYSPFFKCSFVS